MSTKCVRCQSDLSKAVVLVCDHQICLQCAQQLKKPEGTPPLDAKFRIICPKCHKNTLTRNVQNLINEENDKFLFDNMESSQLNESSLGQVIPNDPQKPKFTQRQLKQMTYSQRFSNIWAQRKTPDITQRGSKASNDSKKHCKNSSSRSGTQNSITTQCHLHKQNLMFYCDQEKRVMCMQCIYKHTKDHKSHKVYQIKQAISSIESENKRFKQQAKKKLQQIDKCIGICKSNKGKVQQAYQIHQQLIDKQFKQLQVLIKTKRSQTLEYLQKVFEKKQKDVNLQINDFGYLKNCLKQHYDYPLDNQQSHLYFFNAYSIMRDAINKGSMKIKPFDKQELTCFDKLCSISDFRMLLDRFLRPKKDGRQSKAQSRGGSESGNPPQKSKNIVYDQQKYKSAKKNLQKINKMQKQHKQSKDKNFHYLNNYVIDIQKKDGQNQKNAVMIRQRKSSIGAYTHHDQKKIITKALTPTRLTGSKTKKK